MRGRCRQFFSSLRCATGRRAHRPAKLRPLDAGEHDELSCRSSLQIAATPRPPGRMASTISTPGMMGRLGKCPAKNGSLMVTFLMATIRCLRWISTTRSISKKGKRVRQDVENVGRCPAWFLPAPELRRWVSGVGHWVLVRLWSSGAEIILYRDSATEYCEKQNEEESPEETAIIQPVPTETANRCAFLPNGMTPSPKPFASWWKSNRPSDNNRPWTNWERSWPAASKKIGGHAKFHRVQNFGDHLQVDFSGGAVASPCCCWAPRHGVSLGTLATMPCRAADGRIWGRARLI